MRLIDADMAMRKIREYMEDYPNAPTRLAACRACLSILGDKQQLPTIDPESLRPVSREQVEKWRGEWVCKKSPYDYKIFVCNRCGKQINIQGGPLVFCPRCGSPMTDKAVDILLKRLEEMQNAQESDL